MSLPSHRRGTITYWFWDHIPDEALIRTQLIGMQQAGITGVQIQARLSLPIEDYLSPAYLGAVETSLRVAAELGLEVGFYDEYAWQSGSAGGRATESRPDLGEAFLFWHEVPSEGGVHDVDLGPISSSAHALGEAGVRWHYRGAEVAFGDIKLLGFLANDSFIDAGDSQLVAKSTVGTIAGTLTVDPSLSLPTGSLAIFAATVTSSRSINYLSHEGVSHFLRAGYDPFWESAEKAGAHSVTHVFYDQPHPHAYAWEDARGGTAFAFPYADDLWSTLGAGDAPSHVEALQVITGQERDEAALITWWRFFTRFAITTFFEPIQQWCRERGLALSGHEMLGHVGGWGVNHAFQDFNLLSNFGLDYFQVGSWRDVTAIDMQDTAPQLSPVFGRSIAHAKGDRSLWAELYLANSTAGTGDYIGAWNLRASEFRATILRGALQGITRFILHGYYLTDGHHDPEARPFTNLRHDFPPGFNFLPWFAPLGPEILAETHRVQDLLLDSERVCRVELVYPLTEIWAGGRDCPAAEVFGQVAQALDSRGVDYWIVPDEQAADSAASASGATFRFTPARDGRLVQQMLGHSEVTTVTYDEAVDLATAAAEADWVSAPGGERVEIPRYAGVMDDGRRVGVCFNSTSTDISVGFPGDATGSLCISDGTGASEELDVAPGAQFIVAPGSVLTAIFDGTGPLVLDALDVAQVLVVPEDAVEIALTELPREEEADWDQAVEPPRRSFRGSVRSTAGAELWLRLPASSNSFVVTLDGKQVAARHGADGTAVKLELPGLEAEVELLITSYGGSERKYYGHTRHREHFVRDWESAAPAAHIHHPRN